MRQRQVRQDAVVISVAQGFFQGFHNAFGGSRDALKAVHHAFGLTGGTRGVHDHGQIGGRTRNVALQGWRLCHHVVPFCKSIVGRQGKRNAWHVGRHKRRLQGPRVQLANEQEAGLAVVQHIANGFASFGWEDGHRGAACHPDGQLRHDEVRAIFGQDGHFGTRRQVVGFQISGHRTGLTQGFSPGVVNHLTLPYWLRHVHKVRSGFLMGVDVVQNQGRGAHGVLSIQILTMFCRDEQTHAMIHADAGIVLRIDLPGRRRGGYLARYFPDTQWGLWFMVKCLQCFKTKLLCRNFHVPIARP